MASSIIDTPVASNSITNKPASAAKSLYQTCIHCRSRLYRVDGFAKYLDAEAFVEMSTGSTDIRKESGVPEEAEVDGPIKSMTANDPVTQLWQTFRLGAPLCFLYNALDPAKPLAINPDANRQNLNACKQSTARFIMACQQDVALRDGGLFILAQLYQNDTNGFVQVIRTVEKLLDVLESRGMLAEDTTENNRDLTAAPKDNRAKVLMELLLTERKYVQDLETLQSYAKELLQNDVLSQDTVHHLFANLNSLLDFQRRFLIGVEANAGLPQEQQRFGGLFMQMESAFSVYEPFCANYAHASDLVIRETSNLAKLSHIMDPNYELPAFLIKPIQRICKYPLLLRELVKYTDKEDPTYHDIEQGFASISRVVDRVNETRRQQENGLIVDDLQQRVEDWKGHSVASFGRLLLDDNFAVSKNESEREYHVYLFERILLCCKEVAPKELKKKTADGRNSAALQRKNTNQKKNGTLQLKGRIFMNNVIASVPQNNSAGHTLQVYWRGDLEQESFILRCRNEEQVRQWHTQISKIVDEINLRKSSVQSAPSTYNRAVPSSSTNSRPVHMLQSGSSYQSIGSTGGSASLEGEPFDDVDDDAPGMLSRSNDSLSRKGRGGLPNGRNASTGLPQVYPNAKGIYTVPAGHPSNEQAGSLLDRRAASGRLQDHLRGGINAINLNADGSERSSPEGSPSTLDSRFSQTTIGGGRNTQQSFRSDGRAPSQNAKIQTNGSVGYQKASHRLSGISGDDSESSSGKSREASFARPPTHSSTTSVGSAVAGNGYLHDQSKLSIPSPLDGYHPGIPSPIAGSISSNAGVIKVKVNYGDDIFVIATPTDATFADLSQRVEKKVRLCGGRAPTPLSQVGSGRTGQAGGSYPSALRIKYMDEDGDLVTINHDDDVQMAIELSRALGNVVTLYVA